MSSFPKSPLQVHLLIGDQEKPCKGEMSSGAMVYMPRRTTGTATRLYSNICDLWENIPRKYSVIRSKLMLTI